MGCSWFSWIGPIKGCFQLFVHVYVDKLIQEENNYGEKFSAITTGLLKSACFNYKFATKNGY
jgi:hypothetical protein